MQYFFIILTIRCEVGREQRMAFLLGARVFLKNKAANEGADNVHR